MPRSQSTIPRLSPRKFGPPFQLAKHRWCFPEMEWRLLPTSLLARTALTLRRWTTDKSRCGTPSRSSGNLPRAGGRHGLKINGESRRSESSDDFAKEKLATRQGLREGLRLNARGGRKHQLSDLRPRRSRSSSPCSTTRKPGTSNGLDWWLLVLALAEGLLAWRRWLRWRRGHWRLRLRSGLRRRGGWLPTVASRSG
jgi:hypothetical protein